MSRVVQERRARQTGTVVLLIDNRDREEDSEMDWLTICDDHAGICGYETRALAERFAPVPDEWCPGCQDRLVARSGWRSSCPEHGR